MAIHLLKHLQKSSILRQKSCKQIQSRRRNATSSNPDIIPKVPKPQTNVEQQSVVPLQSNMGLPLAVGISLGLGIGAVAQSPIMKRLFPDEKPIPETPAAPQHDPVLMQEVLNLSRDNAEMKAQFQRLTNDLREKDQFIAQQLQKQKPVTNSNVFELAKVIEANDLASANRHKRELQEQHKALTRDYMLRLEGEILKVENKYKPIVNSVKQLEAHLESQEAVRRMEEPARLLLSVCHNLLEKLRFSPHEPLEKSYDYQMLKKLATSNNPLAVKVLETLPPKALKEGVCSEETLIDRFSRLEVICKRVALVGENGAGLGKYLVSYLQSLFIFNNIHPSEDELSGKVLVDPTSWSTYDILVRVRWCLKEHNIEQAIRYANQLRGQARVAARDWIRDARIHLETKQAINILATYAKSINVKASRESVINE